MNTSNPKNIPTFPALETKTLQGKSKYAPEYRDKIIEQLLDDSLNVSIADLATVHNLNEGTISSWRTQYNKKMRKNKTESVASDMTAVIQGLRDEIKNTDKLIKAIEKDVEDAEKIILEADDKKAEILARKVELENLLEASKKLKL
ncbi:transposase [Psychrobacter lutiphocae]|uniref:transposase n=1 Tax=Psychrobacter lutiphocae TaxID=540500 RepID=UPI000369DFE2|nr:transposase [Psychrobacter lutiphocae]